MSTATSTCRDCGARIKWAVTSQGRKLPFDADPVVFREGAEPLYRLRREVSALRCFLAPIGALHGSRYRRHECTDQQRKDRAR